MTSKKKEPQWKEVSRTFLPESTTIHPATGKYTYTYAHAMYNIVEEKVIGNVHHIRERQEPTEAFVLDENMDLWLAFKVAAPALQMIEAKIRQKAREQS